MKNYPAPYSLALIAWAALACAKPPAPAPRDIEIVAHFYPGYSSWRPWEVTISSDGAILDKDRDALLVQIELEDDKKTLETGVFSYFSEKAGRPLDAKDRAKLREDIAGLSKELSKKSRVLPTKLTHEELRRLEQVVSEIDFVNLPRHISPSHQITDLATLELRVRSGGVEHASALYGWSFVRDQEAARRFIRLWRQVLELAPPHNKGQTADSYR